MVERNSDFAKKIFSYLLFIQKMKFRLQQMRGWSGFSILLTSDTQKQTFLN